MEKKARGGNNKSLKKGQLERGQIFILDIMDVDKGELLSKRFRGYARGLLMEMLYRYGGMNQREIGDLMGIDYSAVSVGRKRFHVLQKKDRALRKKNESVKLRLSQG
jgi:DNA-binding MarR family transcriptional regulator